MSGKLPFMQFYPDQWLTEPGLRACSLAARGLWMDLLSFMWKASPERGVLKTGAQVWGLEQIANAESIDPKNAQDLLNELLKNHVTERRKRDGALICRRMVREERARNKAHSRIKRHRMKRSCNAPVTPEKSEVIFQKSEVRSKSSSDDDPISLLPELQGEFGEGVNEEFMVWACKIIRDRASAPPGSLAYWRIALRKFIPQAWEEHAAWLRRTETEREAHAGYNPYGRTN